jgi:hypothetical protein
MVTTINGSDTFNTAYGSIGNNATELSDGEKNILENLVLFDKNFADNYNNNNNNYDTGLYYTGTTSAENYQLRLSTVTDEDINQYVQFLKAYDNNSNGFDDTVTARNIKKIVTEARTLSLLETPTYTIDEIQTSFGFLNQPENKAEGEVGIRLAVAAFDKLDDSSDKKISKSDLRAFARTYGLNKDQKEQLEDLYDLGNVFGN